MKYNNLIITTYIKHLVYYPTPPNLNYFWNFGFLAGCCLVFQIVTGIFCAMHYSADVLLSFNSVEHIMRDVNGGATIRYIHSNGASMFLLIVYIHMAKGLFYRSYYEPRGLLWVSGVILFLLLMATAFLGYVLPWGQMSFWGATVITNLASAIPIIGPKIAFWLWGGFAVDNATLIRFFALHYLLPFVMAGMSLMHLALLHSDGSTNPFGPEKINDSLPFYPYFIIKDVIGLFFLVVCLLFLLSVDPNYLGHPDNYIRANPLSTPAHIVPEWYFLPFYAILRSIPDKLGGVSAMVIAILILLIIPYVDAPTGTKWDAYKASFFRSDAYKSIFGFFVLSFILLGWLGAQPVEYPYTQLSKIATMAYFTYFLVYI